MPRVKKKKHATKRKQREQDKPRLGFGARLSLLVVITIAIIVVLSWVWNSGWPQTIKNYLFVSSVEVTKEVGFSVSDVTVQGRHYTNRKDLFNALDIEAGSPIFLFDPEKAHKNIMALPWTSKVSVLRSLPNKIMIKLVERQPIARLQHKKKTIVIDSQGQKLNAAKPEEFTNLPLVVGDAAPKQTRYLMTTLQRHPAVSRRLKAAVRVGKRRWDLHLRPKTLVRLPERNLTKALEKLTLLIQEKKVLERNIKAIDLRLSSRMTLEPYKEATFQ